MPNSPQARSLTSTEIYALWSQVYDEQPNPMLSLEHRVLGALLPDVENRDVLDLGCGTGRWLATLSNKSPASLVGLDISPQMLQQAALKLGPRAKLLQRESPSRLRGSSSRVFRTFSFTGSEAPLRSNRANATLRRHRFCLRPASPNGAHPSLEPQLPSS